MPKLKDLQADVPQQGYFPGHATAGTAIEQVVFRAPFRCVITAVEFTPNTAQSGADTNYFTLNLRNRGTGAATTVAATLAFVAGVDLVALTPKSLTLGAAATLALAEGDVVTLQKAITGNGLACPAGAVTVHVKAA